MSVLSDLAKNRLLTVSIIGLVVGFLIGWLVMGYVIWPVQYIGQAHTYELAAPDKEQYLMLVADSFKLTGNAKEARDRLAGWDNGEVSLMIANLASTLRSQGRLEEAKRLEDLGGALGAGLPSGSAPSVSQASTSTSGFSLMSVLRICIGLIVILAVIAAVLFVVDRQRRKVRVGATHTSAEKTPLTPEAPPGALAQFTSRYTLGDDTFDESFTIETQSGEFLGECGIGISESIEAGPPDRVTAFEIWLFDKSDIKTVTKVLMSEYAYNEPGLRDKLAPKGDAVLAAPGEVIRLETASLTLDARITELEYGTDSQYGNSYFASLAIELAPYVKA